ncbi:hypothetical protein [Methylocapsa acidiphila]|uniref:hypothetical protein n=1 Tax=Methylocapsa acidiphila TaxID=133552 RepID=UPI0004169C24|nr:hypothetical protein [Methylocapsa acidiphila]
MIALYALLLQAMISSAAGPAAFDPSAGVTCADEISQTDGTGGASHHHSTLCCIVACASAACAYIAVAFGIAVFPARASASAYIWERAPAGAAQPPLKFYFGARGPPAIV